MVDEETLCFFDQNFLAARGPLTEENIMEYFSISQFYNKGCVNEILKMQSIYANIDISHNLTTTEGFYYVLEHQDDNLFIIAKKEYDGTKTRFLKIYYCIHGHIYCAPTLQSVSDARLIDAFFFINEALDKYEEKKKFNWLKGLQFRDEDIIEDNNLKESKFMLEALHDFETLKNSKI